MERVLLFVIAGLVCFVLVSESYTQKKVLNRLQEIYSVQRETLMELKSGGWSRD